jgi:hypothetical protein
LVGPDLSGRFSAGWGRASRQVWTYKSAKQVAHPAEQARHVTAPYTIALVERCLRRCFC